MMLHMHSVWAVVLYTSTGAKGFTSIIKNCPLNHISFLKTNFLHYTAPYFAFHLVSSRKPYKHDHSSIWVTNLCRIIRNVSIGDKDVRDDNKHLTNYQHKNVND